MTVTIQPGKIAGDVTIIPSKSHLHRLLIVAALADEKTFVRSGATEAEDVVATCACLQALGAEIERVDGGFSVMPVNRNQLPQHAVLPVHESGATLRFMLPVVCALGVASEFRMAGRLPQRPMKLLEDVLSAHGIEISRPEPNILCCQGQLQAGHYILPGDVSSQYITGLLLALPLLDGDSKLDIVPPIESQDYIEMTLEALRQFDCNPKLTGNCYDIRGRQVFKSPAGDGGSNEVQAEGDWSNAAFWLCAGAMPGGDIRLAGMQAHSRQGDRGVADLLACIGARLSWRDERITAKEHARRALTIDATDIPDLIPVLSAVAAVSDGVTVVKNAARLRLKESDRLASTAATLNALGGQVTELPDGLEIVGVPSLTDGTVDAWGDHRIAMMAGIASAACEGAVTITGAEAVAKSYPQFWRELARLGKEVTYE
ncbi:MAG: 3-phosphoshikimate 1-carboxyvinyltransferase [Oscillospiraceae bacterium]|nr:3-phosphoshikimate 1-carboxyvinyltransferase [Oscillospiraceae bacterium]